MGYKIIHWKYNPHLPPSHGGHLLVAAVKDTIVVYNTITFATMFTLKGHQGQVGHALLWIKIYVGEKVEQIFLKEPIFPAGSTGLPSKYKLTKWNFTAVCSKPSMLMLPIIYKNYLHVNNHVLNTVFECGFMAPIIEIVAPLV